MEADDITNGDDGDRHARLSSLRATLSKAKETVSFRKNPAAAATLSNLQGSAPASMAATVEFAGDGAGVATAPETSSLGVTALDDALIAELQQSLEDVMAHSSNLVAMTITEQIGLFHELDADLRSKGRLIDQVVALTNVSLPSLRVPLESSKNVLAQYIELSPQLTEILDNVLLAEEGREHPPKADAKAERKLFNSDFSGENAAKGSSSTHFNNFFGGPAQSGKVGFNPMGKAPRQNPYRHKAMPMTKSAHQNVLRNMNGNGNRRRLFSNVKNPSSFTGFNFGGGAHPFGQNDLHRRMFNMDWPTDAPAPTASPVESDPLSDNCDLLVECVQRMSLYDLFVLYHSDDILPSDGTLDIQDDADDPFLNFRTFDEENIAAKFNTVKTLAEQISNGSQPTRATCSSLLEEFHRIIEVDIVNNWQGSSVSEVCLAEGTPVYVRLAEIAKLKTDAQKIDETLTPTLGVTIANSVFRDILSCSKKLTPVNEENPFADDSDPNISG
ncbi:MAG: hypothetical protein SGILL_003343 [Bacillariaceae sp.]